jgi:hypothetical protein
LISSSRRDASSNVERLPGHAPAGRRRARFQIDARPRAFADALNSKMRAESVESAMIAGDGLRNELRIATLGIFIHDCSTQNTLARRLSRVTTQARSICDKKGTGRYLPASFFIVRLSDMFQPS